MSLPRFLSRISDAVAPLIPSGSEFESLLEQSSVRLVGPPSIDEYFEHRAGFLFAANLLARLYPRLEIVCSKSLAEECASRALAINPACEVATSQSKEVSATLNWGTGLETPGVSVSPRQWTVALDTMKCGEIQKSSVLTALSAAAIGVGEIFRIVFADLLPSPRIDKTPTEIDLFFDGEKPDSESVETEIALGTVHLAGAGAVGQAAIYSLAQMPIAGKLVVVDPEVIEVSNLQRYVLSVDSDVGISKCALAGRALAGSQLKMVGKEMMWDIGALNERLETVCTALDTADARIGVQAALPRNIYNAWTQPADIGWSRHEFFGQEPCLACLYVPSGERPSLHQQVAAALRQPELRVLAYLIFKVPAGSALSAAQIPSLPAYPLPEGAAQWTDRSILEDVISELGVSSEIAERWVGRQLSDLYREGICGGAIVTTQRGGVPQEFAVPLAHQSALAGVMLAAELVLSKSRVTFGLRSRFIEGRLDVLRGYPQVTRRPRQRASNCLCSDSDFLRRYEEKWR